MIIRKDSLKLGKLIGEGEEDNYVILMYIHSL